MAHTPSKFRSEHRFDLPAIIAPRSQEIKDNILALATPVNGRELSAAPPISLTVLPSHLISLLPIVAATGI
jgi:hypothetical protein